MPVNEITLVGNVTRDPELRFTPSGAATASFGIAVNRRYKEPGSDKWSEETSFFDVTCWRELAENVSATLERGARAIVVGRLQQRTWEGSDGEKRSKVEIVADSIGPDLRWATRESREDAAHDGWRATAYAPPDYGDEEPF